MDIATLGLTIVNDAAVRVLDATSRKLDELGDTGEKAHERVNAASQKVTNELIRQQEQVRALGAQYSQLSSGDLANASTWFDKTYGSMSKTSAATAEIADKSGTAVGGIGRMRQSFASLAAQVTGTNPMLDRIVTTLGAFEVGNAVVIGVLAGVAAVAFGIHELSGVSEQSEKALASLRSEIERDGDALGSMSVKAADAEAATAKHLLGMAGSVKEFFSTTNLKALYEGAVGFVTGGAGGAAGGYAGSLLGAGVQGKADQTQAANDSQRKRADALATLIRDNNASHAERLRAIADLKSDRAELLALQGKFDDTSVSRRLDLSSQAKELNDALYPKERAGKKPSFLDHIRFDSGIKADSYRSDIDTPAKQSLAASLKSVVPELQNSGALQPLRNLTDLGQVMIARSDITNASRSQHGQGALPEDQQLTQIKKQATETAQTIEQAVLASNLPWKDQLDLLTQINDMLKKIGANAPKSQSSALVAGLDKATSYARTGADVINLFGSSQRSQQEGSIVNTGANAIDDFTHGNIAQGVVAVASFAKQVAGLGGTSHDAARGIQEAQEALKTTLAVTQDSLTHNTLQGLLDQDKITYDQLYKSINDTLPGLKNQAQRTIDLTAATADYNTMVAQTQANYALQMKDFGISTTAATDRAKGLTYQADMLDLQVQQDQALQTLIDQGIIMADGTGTAAQRSAYIAEQQLFAAQKSAVALQELTQVTNAPSGFFAEQYLGLGSSSPTGITPPPQTTTYGTLSNGPGITGPTTTTNHYYFPVSGAGDPDAVADRVVAKFRAVRDATVGPNGSLSDALELYPS